MPDKGYIQSRVTEMFVHKRSKTMSSRPDSEPQDLASSQQGALPRKRAPHAQHLTFTLKSLSHYAPEQGAAVVAEGRHLVVVDTELVRDVDPKPLLSSLQKGNRRTRAAMSHLPRKP